MKLGECLKEQIIKDEVEKTEETEEKIDETEERVDTTNEPSDKVKEDEKLLDPDTNAKKDAETKEEEEKLENKE